jgi:hypothetical protein
MRRFAVLLVTVLALAAMVLSGLASWPWGG